MFALAFPEFWGSHLLLFLKKSQFCPLFCAIDGEARGGCFMKFFESKEYLLRRTFSHDQIYCECKKFRFGKNMCMKKHIDNDHGY